jgi:hypothetical protein
VEDKLMYIEQEIIDACEILHYAIENDESVSSVIVERVV